MKNWINDFLLQTDKTKLLDLLKKEGPFFKQLRDFLGFNEIKTHVFALTCALKTHRGTNYAELMDLASSYIKKDVIKNVIEELLSEQWLTIKTQHNNEFLLLTKEVEQAIEKANPKLLPSAQSDPANKVIRRICAASHQTALGYKSLAEWSEFVDKIYQNKRLSLVQYLQSFNLNNKDLRLLLYITAQYINQQEPVEFHHIFKAFGSDSVARFMLKHELMKPESQLFDHGLLERGCFVSLELSFKPSANLLKICMPKLQINPSEIQHKLHPALQVQDVEKFKLKTLFYNKTDQQQIALIQQILSPDKQELFKKHLSENEQFSGITVMLSGGPGVGKTELVKQIAKKSKRGLFLFVPSKQRSKWYGESEKAIQAVFDDYKKAAQQAELTPILFFNEADSIISKRTNSENSTSNTENVIQTILLQELEQFDGILICTTNRPDAFDEAFSRRFLFQIHIAPPDELTRQALLKHHYFELTPEQTTQLSQFAFTAAELDNFNKQMLINRLANSEPKPIYDALADFLVSLHSNGSSGQIGYQFKN